MIITMVSISLDGFMEGPDHDISWHHMSEDMHDYINADLATMSALLSGRRTHELMLQAWPHAEDNPDYTQKMREFAPIWRNVRKIVYSRTREFSEWNSETRREVDATEIRNLPGDSMIGGSDLLETFFEQDLVDEVRLYVNPVAIGSGTPFFKRPNALTLKETRKFDCGVVLLTYSRA